MRKNQNPMNIEPHYLGKALPQRTTEHSGVSISKGFESKVGTLGKVIHNVRKVES